jgi:thiol-disulfide isomerase/thioredoxin
LEGEDKALVDNLDQRLRLNPGADISNNFTPAFGQPQPQQMQQQQPQSSPVGVDQVPVAKSSNKKKEEEEDDSDFEDDFDDDGALEAFRQRRLAELKRSAAQEDEHKAKGHGEVRTIVQDEFLPECTSSFWVAVHFFHRDFERCKIMDHHLKRIAPLHLSCKFVRIDAEKTPFFVGKLNIKTLPTLLVFKDGKTVNRLLGFDGLGDFKNPDEFTTSSLGRFLERTGCIEYEGPDSDDEGETNTLSRATVRKAMMQSRSSAYDEDV